MWCHPPATVVADVPHSLPHVSIAVLKHTEVFPKNTWGLAGHSGIKNESEDVYAFLVHQ